MVFVYIKMVINNVSTRIRQCINSRNGKLTSTEVAFVTDINLHPQLNRITYNPCNASCDMWDR